MSRMFLSISVIVGVAAAAIAGDATPTSRPAVTSRPAQKHAIPIYAPALSGAGINFPDAYRGKLVLVTFWASWCPVCKREIPYWKDAYARFQPQGLEIIGLATDANRNRGPELVQKAVADNGMTWEQVYDGAPDYSLKYGANIIPAAYLVDADTGVIVAQGGALRKENLAKTIAKYLSVKAGRPTATSAPAQK